MIRIIIAVSKKNRIINSRAYPLSFMIQRIVAGMFAVLFPLFIYYFVFEGRVSSDFQYFTQTKDYVTYIILGNSVYILCFSTLMNVGRCMIQEIREGTLHTFLISPASRIGYFVGVYLEQLMRSLIEFMVVFFFGIILGARIPFIKVFYLIIVLFIISVNCFSMAILMSMVMILTRDTYLTQNTIITLIGFISGIFFPIELLPKWIQFLSNCIPITVGLKLFRAVILSDSLFVENLKLLVVVVLESIAYFLIGILIFRRIEKKLIEEIYN